MERGEVYCTYVTHTQEYSSKFNMRFILNGDEYLLIKMHFDDVDVIEAKICPKPIPDLSDPLFGEEVDSKC